MLLQRSKLAAANVKRPRLAPPWLVVMLGGMVTGVLVASYPREDLIKRVLAAPPDELTEAYLVNLLRTDPQNPSLRLVLARSQMQAGLFDRVGTTLAPSLAAADPDIRREAMWLYWRSEEARFKKLSPDSPAYESTRQRLRQQLEALAEQESDDDVLIDIVRKAFDLGDMALARRVLTRLANEETHAGPQIYTEAARVALAAGEYRAAAEFHLLAADRAPLRDEERRQILAALHALQAGDRLPDALDLAADQIKRRPWLEDDLEVLETLVRFARAARRPDLADHYAKRMLRLSLLLEWRRRQLALDGFDAMVRRVALTSEPPEKGPRLPFDDRLYTLGFEAFLDNRNLEDAWKVAASAVHQAPENMLWRERLAQVSEWSGRPQIALENWLYLARTSNREEAWQAVLRLSPGLFDDTALSEALRQEAARNPGDAALRHQLVAVYERLGEPERALRFLEETYRQHPQPELRVEMAELSERMGDDARALKYWLALQSETGLTPAQAVRVGVLLLIHGQPAQALTVLERTQARAEAESGSDTPFWRLIADLARRLQEDELAKRAYGRVLASNSPEPGDYDSLISLLGDEHPLEAARLAAAAWRRFHQPRQLLGALGNYAAANAWSEMGRLLNEAESETETRRTLQSSTDFLLLSAQYLQHVGRSTQARAQLERALRLAPESGAVRQALLWQLIDTGEADALRRLLAAYGGQWRANTALHDALGAAYLALGQPGVALRDYYTPHLAEHRNDFLWLMNYADALEQNQEKERAWQLRRALLQRERPAAVPSAAIEETRRLAYIRLRLAAQPGDAALSTLRELLRLDRAASAAPKKEKEDKQEDGKDETVEPNGLSPGARDLVLGWLIDGGHYDQARLWLWQQYARTTARPAWATLSLALADNDIDTASRLLERQGDTPSRDRASLAIQAGDVRQAQSDTFALLEQQPDDTDLHQQASEALLDFSNHAGGVLVKRDLGGLRETEAGLRWHLALSPAWGLDLSSGRVNRTNDDPAGIGYTPDERYDQASLLWRRPDSETRMSIAHRDSLTRYTPIVLQHLQRIDRRLSIDAALGHHQSTDESTAMRIAGMQNRAQLGLNYQVSARDRLRLETRWSRFEAQTGTRLGDGHSWQVEAAHALQLEPRDLEIGAFWSTHSYSRRQGFTDSRLARLLPDGLSFDTVGSDFFLPEDFRFYGIRLSTGMRFEESYTRAWQPYANLARTWHSVQGPGYDLSAGLAGSVFGNDHLQLGWKYSKSGAGTTGPVHEIGLTYRLHY